MRRIAHAWKVLLLSCILLAGVGAAMPGYATPAQIRRGDKLQAFPVKTGTINVYEDSDCDEIRTKVKRKNLVVTITGFENGAYYGKYKQGGESGKGWFKEKTFLKTPSFENQNEMKEVLGGEYADYNLVLATPYGSPIGEASIRKRFAKLIQEHDLPKE